MRLTRKQKRWIREHKGLINLIRFVVILAVAALLYFVATLFNDSLKPGNLFGKKEPAGIQEPSGGDMQNTDSTESKYVSSPVVLDEPETELSDVEKAALEYTPDPEQKKPYLIRVNRAANCVTVYGIDESGFYSIPVRAMVCSTGKSVGDTPVGNGAITDKYVFHPMVDGTYGQYAVRFMSGGILFHSVPYYTQEKDNLETDQFNLLGQVASLGCVRLCVRDALWIYENCPEGTDVIVYDDAADPGPLGKPEMINIPINSQFAGWDPTDPDTLNPWHQYSAMISGAKDTTIPAGGSYDPRSGVTAVDTCGNDITDRMKLSGTYDTGLPGTYNITYSVTDLIGSSATQTVTLTVTDTE
ncbi:MAG: DUF5011 domain-containing protein [Alistipes sp.]|nr:DUF5011 domain-containing protein [Alistipes sp.]